MSILKLKGSTSGYVELKASAVAGDSIITLPTIAGTLDRLERTGNILQVVSATKTDTQSTSAASWVDVGSLSLSITPSRSSNKILLIAQLTVSNSGGAAFSYCYFRFTRSGTAVGVGDAAGSRLQTTGQIQSVSTDSSQSGHIQFLDSPSTTSAITYKVQVYNQQAAQTTYINRSTTDTDSSSFARSISTLTALEVAA
jgi:hypothetical protein